MHQNEPYDCLIENDIAPVQEQQENITSDINAITPLDSILHTESSSTFPSPRNDLLSFYKFTSNPFIDSLNPDFFFKTINHERIFMRMMMSIEQDIALAMTTGRSGTGKSLVSQMILNELPQKKYQAALVLVTPGMTKTALLKEMIQELGFDVPEKARYASDLLAALTDAIIQIYTQNKKPVIIIDECHLLSAEGLHTIRTLSNVEIPDRKLLTCILFSEPRLLKRLEHPSYHSLNSRLYMRTALKPLSREEHDQYIKYRLLVAGGKDDFFSDESLEMIYKLSEGICRQINKICCLALMEGFLAGEQDIKPDTIRKCMN